MSRIKALHLLNSFGDSSISRIVMRLVSGMETNDIEWHIGGLSGEGRCAMEFRRLGIHPIDFSENGSKSRSAVLPNIRHYLSAHDITLVHTHTPRTIFAAAFAIKSNQKVTHVATKHLLTRPADRRWGALFTVLDRLSLYLPDWLVPVSQVMHTEITRQLGIRAEKVATIYNAIPCNQYYAPEDRIPCRNELGIPADSLVLTYVGRIQKVKQIGVLLAGFRRISQARPNTSLVIVGDGDERPQMVSYAEDLGISGHVIWTGYRTDVPRILAASDIYVQTSVNEGLSLSLLEAMAAGKPIVATDVGGNSEIISDGVNGSLIPAGSATEFANAVLWLIENPQIQHRFASAGLELVRSRFSLDRMVVGYRRLYGIATSERVL